MQNADKIAGWPVRFRVWGRGAVPPGVNPGGYDEARYGYSVLHGDVVESADGMTFGKPAEVEFIPVEDMSAMQMRTAAAVAKRVAQEATDRVANPVGEFSEPTDEQMVKAVKAARKARLEAWSWNVMAQAREADTEVPERVKAYLT